MTISRVLFSLSGFFVLIFFAHPLCAKETLEAARIGQFAVWLPAQPAGFAWPVTNRAAWKQLARNHAFANVRKKAEAALIAGLPPQPDSLYLEFSRTGNRSHWQEVAKKRRDRIETLVLAEAMENEGHYLPALEETIVALCAEKTWVLPAHDAGLKNFRGVEIIPDLGATTLAAELAEADYVLGDRLSPATRQLIRDNVRRRVLAPFRAMVEGRQKEAFWLRARMNWNAVCVGNTVFAALALLDARPERAFFAAAGEHCIHFYISGFSPDGYCAEGMGYWDYGFGHFILLTETLRQATGGKVDLLNDDRAIAAALYCRRSEILPGLFPSISDVTPGTRPNDHYTAYVCQRLGLDAGHAKLVGEAGGLPLTLMVASLPSGVPLARSLTGLAGSPLRSYFPGGGVLLARTLPGRKQGFAVALKGGNNDEPHNHNDVGSFSVVLGTNMVICDPGGEVYTARTFGPHRYDSKVLSSFGHAVPEIAGTLQRAGAEARGLILTTNFTDAADTFALDIRSAYPVPALEKLTRTFVFQRGDQPALEVRDEVKCTVPETFETALITWGVVRDAGPGALEIADGDSTVRVTIDTHGLDYKWTQQIINEDVDTKRKPVRLDIKLAAKTASAVVVLRIEPVAQ